MRVFADVNELSMQAGQAAVRTINESVRGAGRCSLVLSGGNTPRTLYGLLASEFRDQIPWAHVHVFWGDERYVAPDDPDSNYRMAKETLLDHVPCPAGNVHPMPTHFPSADAAARDYENTLRNYFGTDWPHFDLSLLGLGEEGHTASLFPGSPALGELSAVGRRRGDAGRSAVAPHTDPASTHSSRQHLRPRDGVKEGKCAAPCAHRRP